MGLNPAVSCVWPLCAVLGEGPLWWEGALWFTDIKQKKIHRFDPATGAQESWPAPSETGFLAPRKCGHFIAGAKNLEFLPDTSLKTLRWLQKSLPSSAGPFTRKLYHSYGHMDFFIGKDAGKDIFPDLVAELDKYNPKT